MCRVITIANMKGGVAKTTTAANLGIGLAGAGKRVLLADCDPQGSLTLGLGFRDPLAMPYTLGTVIQKIVNGIDFEPGEAILHHGEGVDLVPGSRDLRRVGQQLDEAMSKEHVLGEYIDAVRGSYDYIILDCSPGLDNLTLNALACCDSVLIPTPPEFLSVEGLQELLRVIGLVKKRLNRSIQIEGILLTIVCGRTNIARDIMKKMEEAYGSHVRIFKSIIPESVKAKEAVANGVSVYRQAPGSSVAEAYADFVEEVLS